MKLKDEQKRNQAAMDTQIEKAVMKIIYNRIFVGLPNGEVKLYGVSEAAEDIRNYFESMRQALEGRGEG